MKIFIRPLNGRQLTIEVGESDTVYNVKAKVEERQGIECELQRLIYAGKQLEDDHPLSDYMIHQEATLNMILREMPQVSVQLMNGKSISIDAIPSRHTVGDVKTKVQQIENIPCDQQMLIFKGKQLEEDGHKLSSYDILEKSTLHLVLREKGSFQVFIRTLAGRIITVDVSKADTVRDVKIKVQSKNGVQPDQQRLMFAGRQLKDKQQASYYNIKDESTLDLIVHDEVFSADTACALLARMGEQENCIAKLEDKVSSQDKSIRDLERQMHYIREQLMAFQGADRKR